MHNNIKFSFSEPGSDNIQKSIQPVVFQKEDPFLVLNEGGNSVETAKTVANTNISASLLQPKVALHANEEELIRHYSNDPFRYYRI